MERYTSRRTPLSENCHVSYLRIRTEIKKTLKGAKLGLQAVRAQQSMFKKLLLVTFPVGYFVANAIEAAAGALVKSFMGGTVEEAQKAFEFLTSLSESDYEHGQQVHFTASGDKITFNDKDSLAESEVMFMISNQTSI